MAASPAFDSFLLKRDRSAAAAEFPASDVDKEGAALAATLADPHTALQTLLGPELTPLGAAGVPLSEQVRSWRIHTMRCRYCWDPS